MARVTLLGMAPLPFEPALRHHAPGIRSWQLARPLLRAGHRVRLVLCRYAEAYGAEAPARSESPTPEGDGLIVHLSAAAFAGDGLDGEIAREPMDLLVGASVRPSARAAVLAGEVPLWADLFGSTMAEGQAKAILHGDDDLLDDYFRDELVCLGRGDRFSAVSQAQEGALWGELGLAGRLNRATGEWPFTTTIPCAAIDPDPRPGGPPAVRGVRVPLDAVIVLWCGGYNTWADVATLQGGLDRAMAERPELHFVSTGGALGGQDPETYGRFTAAVLSSPHRDRHHLLGWVDRDMVAQCLWESDIGINVDRDLPESRLGSRNRIPTFLAHGLPVVSSRVSEASRYVEAATLGRLFDAGDAAGLGDALVALARNIQAWRARRATSAARALADLSFEATAAPLVAFAAAPSRAPDAGMPVALAARMAGVVTELDARERRIVALEQRIHDAQQHVDNLDALLADKDAALAELRAFEERVKGSLPYRLRRALRGR